ncbi:MAG: hypothetical protein J5533_01695 [Bacteroidales bacterium]|nr:hypothetical protein [Bacteroidales bacterium]
MKRLALFMIGCALLAAGCTKEIAPVEETATPKHLTINIVPSLEVPNTRDVKTGWEAGDKIYVFFNIRVGQSGLEYMIMTYDGSDWVHTFSGATTEQRIMSTSSGYLSALYFPYGTPTFSLNRGDSNTTSLCFKFTFDAIYEYGIGYYCCPKVNYTITDGTLEAPLAMQLMPEDVQFFIPDIPEGRASDFLFSCNHLKRRKVGTYSIPCIDYKGQGTNPSVSFASYGVGNLGDSFKGYPYKGGIVFPGVLGSPGTSQDYVIIVTDTKGTSDTYDDKTYTFKASNKKLKVHDAVRLPALNSGRWEEPGINGHEYVNLGHPSGLKWASCNIGADSPEKYGDYFAWAETATKDDYRWYTYKWMQSGKSSWAYITKYTVDDGKTDGIWYNSSNQFIGDGYKSYSNCNYKDDPARQIWGSTWRTPTDAEWTWLRENCEWTWTDNYNGTGKAGMVVTSKVSGYTGSSLFFPATGCRAESILSSDAGSAGYYWSSSLYEGDSSLAWYVYLISNGVRRYADNRYYGYSVRPVSD